ncbi:MAG: amidohydrolase family protein [Candidatus Thorarchaeota archaeon]
MSEIIIRNGLIVTDKEEFQADIKLKDEKIVKIEKNIPNKGEITREINAEGLLVLPGGIDPHVHLSLPDYVPEKYRWADDFESGSKAALAGGITTLGCISIPGNDETLLGILEREEKTAKDQLIADLMIHPVLLEPNEEKLKEFPKLVEKGCTTIKIFMVTEDFAQHTRDYFNALQAAKENNLLSMMHCEDYNMIHLITEKMISEGKGSLKNYANSRPEITEVAAVKQAITMCEKIKAPIYIVHLSSEKALRVCEKAQKNSLPVYVEGRPIFFYLTREKYLEEDGALYVVQPPLREKKDTEALWEGLNKGSIHTLATDHAPHTREQKLDPSLNVQDLLPGINELQVMLPMMYYFGVVKGRISLKRFVELTSTNPAKLFGLYPRKGTIRIDSDADITIWDPKEERIIEDTDMFSKAGFSIYNGWKTTGWPIITIRRGEIVYEQKQICAKLGSGKILHRGAIRYF